MATITLRAVKGAPLTTAEADGNFSDINDELPTALTYDSSTKELSMTTVGSTTKTADLSSLVDDATALSIALG